MDLNERNINRLIKWMFEQDELLDAGIQLAETWAGDKEIFLYQDSHTLGMVIMRLNQHFNSKAWRRWSKLYELEPSWLRRGYYEMYSDLRLGKHKGTGQLTTELHIAYPPYRAPDELIDITDLFGQEVYDYRHCAACQGCNTVVDIAPTSYGWRPDFWYVDGEGYYCGSCVAKSFAEEYIEHCTSAAESNELFGCDLVDPEDHGFRLVAEGLEVGLHEGQSDSPKKVQAFLIAAGYEVTWVIRSGQFDRIFDLYVRKWDHDTYEVISMRDAEVEMLFELLFDSNGYGYSSLKPEFRQKRSPASIMKEQLKKGPQIQGNGFSITFITAEDTGE
jgi:hypothetical protein